MGKSDSNIIGRLELVGFPELGLGKVRAKIDTGAYGSSIHCQDISVTDTGKLKITFSAEEYQLDEDMTVEFESFSRKSVVSSNGISEERFVIDTVVVLGKQEREITVSFANREKLRHPVLLGRLFLKKHHLLVNPRTKNVLSKGKKK